jgi:phosphoglycolate phosphatase-like HAD superfamily hydrolase
VKGSFEEIADDVAPTETTGETAVAGVRRSDMDRARAFVLDFDHTLFDTDRFFWCDVRSAFARCGIDGGLWEESYARVWPTGYSLEKHLNDLIRAGQGRGSVEAARRVLQDRFSDLGAYLFEDVGPFLRRLHAERIPCFLLSFGDPSWQEYKVRGARIADFFQEIFYTSKEQAKVEAIAPLVGRFARLAVVDNHPRELDRIKARYPQVETFWINRVPPDALESLAPDTRERFREARNYARLSAELPHHRCTSLGEVTL